MVGLGTVIGAVLPVFVVDLGVAPPEAAYTTFFRAACIASGAAVGVLNHLLFRVVVGRRLRRLARRMQVVALNLSDVEAWSEVGPDRRVVVLSHDDLGAPARAFNDVVDALERALADTRALHRELRWRAERDDLTGLPNRAAWLARADEECAREIRGPDAVHVLLVDLDGFKSVNDVHGHAAGDEVLCVLAHRMVDQCRPDDVVARIGGDEFAVLLRPCSDTDVDRIVARLHTELTRPVVLQDGTGVVLGGSIGRAVRRSPDEAVTELLRRADADMYAWKRGRSTAGLRR